MEDQTPMQLRGSVFLRDFIDIDQPMSAVAERLCWDSGWLLPLARRAMDETRSLYLRLGLHTPGHDDPVPMRVLLGRSRPVGTTLFVAVRWEAMGLTGLIPVLDGDLELSPLGDDGCRLALSASYRPPVGAFGEWLGGLALRRIAESLVRSFIVLLGECCDGGDASTKVEDRGPSGATPSAEG